MTMGSVTAIEPPLPINSERRRSTALPVARSNSTQADVSARITPLPGSSVGGRLANGVRASHGQGLLSGHWLARQMSQGQVDGLCLGSKTVAVHDRFGISKLRPEQDPLERVEVGRPVTQRVDKPRSV